MVPAKHARSPRVARKRDLQQIVGRQVGVCRQPGLAEGQRDRIDHQVGSVAELQPKPVDSVPTRHAARAPAKPPKRQRDLLPARVIDVHPTPEPRLAVGLENPDFDGRLGASLGFARAAVDPERQLAEPPPVLRHTAAAAEDRAALVSSSCQTSSDRAEPLDAAGVRHALPGRRERPRCHPIGRQLSDLKIEQHRAARAPPRNPTPKPTESRPQRPANAAEIAAASERSWSKPPY